MIITIITCALAAVCGFMFFKHYMHMFQLNSYHMSEQFKWWFRKEDITLQIPVLAATLFAIGIGRTYDIYTYITLICADVIYITSALNLYVSSRRAKKPLVWTHRVMRMCAASSVLLLALVFVPEVYFTFRYDTTFYAKGFLALPILAFFVIILANIINMPVEYFNNRRYIKEAKEIMKTFAGTAIGVTGSFGKTSVKYFLTKLLEIKYNTVMTPASYNTTLGVVKTVRGSVTPMTEMFVCEMGAKKTGEIKEICDIVLPEYGIITSIGKQHLETFKNIENIINTKFELAEAAKTVFLNIDNIYTADNKNNCADKNVLTYGMSETADYRAVNIAVSESGSTFEIVFPDKERHGFSSKLIGEHNVLNITGAVAVAHSLGLDISELVFGVNKLEPVPHRMEIGVNGNTVIIDDAFNSNPEGARAALNTLTMFGEYTKILVTPGMVELGIEENAENKALGVYAAARCDIAVLVGEKHTAPIKEGLLEGNFSEERIKVVSGLDEGLEFVNGVVGKKVVLLENDLPDNY